MTSKSHALAGPAESAGTVFVVDDNPALREALEGLLVIREKAQFSQTEPQAFLVQNTHHDGFTVIGRQARYAQINQFVPYARLDASVLRNSVFRDGHVRLDLQPADDRRLQTLRRVLHLVHHAVDAVPQSEFLRQRFEMDI